MLLRTLVEKFLLSLEANHCSLRTIESYRERLAGLQRFLEAQGTYGVEEIGLDVMDAWAVALRRQSSRYEDHPRKPIQKGALSPFTIAGRIQAAKRFFKWCVEREYVARSPAAHLKRPKLKHSARPRVMDVGDLRAIEAEAEKRARVGRPRDLAILRFFADTGARVGEMANLRIGELDLPALEAMVDGKTDEGTVDYSEATARALRDWLAVRPRLDHDYVFINLSNDYERFGQPLTTGGIYLILKRLAEAAGVKGRFNPHAIRHLVGQHFTDRTNLELARQKLRHKDIATTADFYANQDRQRVKNASRQFSLLDQDQDDD